MVLALKYRPKTFDEVVGQHATTGTLIASLDKKKLAHAYLFSGLRGSGKTSTSRIFSKALQCDEGPTSKPCEVCENCRMANENRHIDIIEMDGASNRKIDDIREVIEHTKYTPSTGRYKIFIIDEVHMLTKEAFNALLKTLEEPPEYVKFILATTDPLKLPATILSRTQHFRFSQIATDAIKHHIESILNTEDVTFEEKALDLLSKAGKGSLRDTLTLVEQAVIYTKNNITVDSVVDMLGVVNPAIIEEVFEKIKHKEKESIKTLSQSLKTYDIELIFDEMISFLKTALYEATLPLLTIERYFKIIADIKHLIRIGVDSEFTLNLLFFKMIEASKINEIDDLIKQFESDLSSDLGKKEIAVAMAPHTPKESPSKPIETSQSTPIESTPKVSATDLFVELKKRIIDRDVDLGRCFEESVVFISYEDNTLTWESCTSNECREMFRQYFSSVIRVLINETFGIGTKIEVNKCTKEIASEDKKKSEPVMPLLENDPKEEIITKVREVFGSDIIIDVVNDSFAKA